MKQPKEMPKITLRFPEGSKTSLKGFEDVSVNDSVTVVIKAKVSELREKADEWDNGKTVGLRDISSCQILGAAKTVSISDALDRAAKKV